MAPLREKPHPETHLHPIWAKIEDELMASLFFFGGGGAWCVSHPWCHEHPHVLLSQGYGPTGVRVACQGALWHQPHSSRKGFCGAVPSPLRWKFYCL